jgi:hypothetical protein
LKKITYAKNVLTKYVPSKDCSGEEFFGHTKNIIEEFNDGEKLDEENFDEE